MKLKSAIRNESSQVYDNIFGLNKPFQKSLSFMRVALNRGCWGEFESPETVKWLRLHWVSSIAFVGYVMAIVPLHILSRI